MYGKIMRFLFQREPSKRQRDRAAAVLQYFGFGENFLIEDFAVAVGREMRDHQETETLHSNRVSQLLAANNAEVEKRRAAMQTMRGIIAFLDEKAPEHSNAIRAIVSANGLTL